MLFLTSYGTNIHRSHTYNGAGQPDGRWVCISVGLLSIWGIT